MPTLDKPAFIYALVDPRTREVKYIGKSHDPEGRLEGHLHFAGGPPTKKERWISELLRMKSWPPLLVILEKVAPTDDWRAREQSWIRQFAGANLVNGTTGMQKKAWRKQIEERRKR